MPAVDYNNWQMNLDSNSSTNSEVRFGPPRDRMTQLKSGVWVMHCFRAIILNNKVVGTAEFHLQLKGDGDPGVITVTKIRSHKDAL